jgi:predicted nucleic acid-binding protein
MNAIRINPDSCCFVDTNIWFYAFIQTEDEEKCKKAKDIVSHNEVIISTQIINEMSVNLIKKAGFFSISCG